MSATTHPQFHPVIHPELGWAMGFEPPQEEYPISAFVGTELTRTNETEARLAQQSPETAQDAVVTQFVIKTVGPCNLFCTKDELGRGYDCYEETSGEYKRFPPYMSMETARTIGQRIGEHAAQNGLEKVAITLHGGEPLAIPNSFETTEGEEIVLGRAEGYYDELLTTLKEVVAEYSDVALDFGMTTNGTLLRRPVLDVLKKHDVGITVSLDGPQAVHDMTRVMVDKHGRRIGSFKLVEKGLNLLCTEYPNLLKRILAVVNTESDPIAVYDTLTSFELPKSWEGKPLKPVEIDFLLPYATWEDRPYGLDNSYRDREMIDLLAKARQLHASGRLTPGTWPSDHIVSDRSYDLDKAWLALSQPFSPAYKQLVPYADWLLRIFYKNREADEPRNIRFFNSIQSLSLGGKSFVEGIGPDKGREVTIRTDGSYELPDWLRASYIGATVLGMNVADHGLTQVSQRIFSGSRPGKKELSQICKSCDIVNICGGGHEGTQYSQEIGFNNPSVYCLDLEELIRHIRGATFLESPPAPKMEAVARILHRKGYLANAEIPPSPAKPLRPYEERIWLDMTERELEQKIGSLSIGTLHIATNEEEELYGFAKGALVPDPPRPATVDELGEYLASPDVPASLCIEFPRNIPNVLSVIKQAAAEADNPSFVVGDGEEYRLGHGYTGKLLDVIHNNSGEPSTIVPSARNVTPHTHAALAKRVGVHVEHFKDRRNPVGIRAQHARRNLIISTEGPRYHLVMLVSSLAIASRLYEDAQHHVPTVRDLRKFYATHPEEAAIIPVLWIKTEPATRGLAYGLIDNTISAVVSPVEIAGHEGSMRGLAGPSTLTILNGKWQRRAFQSTRID